MLHKKSLSGMELQYRLVLAALRPLTVPYGPGRPISMSTTFKQGELFWPVDALHFIEPIKSRYKMEAFLPFICHIVFRRVLLIY